ncbi:MULTISPECIES: hypothetical protein [unclassified Luteibacter]|jgi:hypothetical protein|uniref:hypothetical protein n=1 Tax=Luteibacter sp. PvP019 TaxID=3156436 RepID=UPI003393BA5A
MSVPTVPVSSSSTGIPFGQGPQPTVGGSFGGMAVAIVLLALAYLALWYLRRRGVFGGVPSVSSPTAGMTVEQRLRVSPTCMAFVLKDADRRMLLVESRHGVHLHALGPDGEGRP